MKELQKICWLVAGGFAVFVVLRVVESMHVYGVLSPNTVFDPGNSVASSFGVYRDFVTIVTGLLTLLIAIIGLGSLFSFKKIRDDEKNALKMIQDEQLKIINLRKEIEDREKSEIKQFDELKNKIENDIDAELEHFRILKGVVNRYIKVSQLNALLSSEFGKETAITAIQNANGVDVSDELIHQYRGDAYYYRGNSDDYAIAIEEYNKAITFNKESTRAWFGLGQAKYKLSVKTSEDDSTALLDSHNVIKYKPKIDKYIVINELIAREGVDNIKRAISYDQNFTEAILELGHMYKALGEFDKALNAYRRVLSLAPSHMACAYFYCQLWIYNNYKLLIAGDIEKYDVGEVIKLLKQVGLFDVYNNKFAYALLWYIYAVDPISNDEASVDSAYSATTDFAISTLFELED